jgi:hypothetical protein
MPPNGTDGLWLAVALARTLLQRDTVSPEHLSGKKEAGMKNLIKSGTFRTLMLLSALASSGLVLEAARRWN